jgi:hypothetical protein
LLNALGELDAEEAEVPPSGWADLADAGERTADEMHPQTVANTS